MRALTTRPSAWLFALLVGMTWGQVARAAGASPGAPTLPSTSATSIAPVTAITPARPSRATRRALVRAHTLLQRGLTQLPRESGLTLSRKSESVVLSVPASVLFAPDSEQLLSDRLAARIVMLVGRVLKTQRRLMAEIQVYTDNIGGTQRNAASSQQRASAVMAALTAVGVPSERVSAVGEGLTSALASNDTPEGRMRNRRVEVVFEPRRPQTPPSTAPTAARADSTTIG